MKSNLSRNGWISLGVTAVLLLLVGAVSVAVAQEPGGDPDPNSDGLTLAALGGPNETHAFSYQGRLMDGGVPADGAYDFLVDLYASETGGTPLAACSNVNSLDGLMNQPVVNGIFNFHLICGGWNSDVFTGGSRWLEIQVRPAGVGSYSLLPRQPISPAPYAWSLYPGAIISSTVFDGGFGDALLNIHANSTGSTWSAFQVQVSTGMAVVVNGNTGVGLHSRSTSNYAIEADSSTSTAGDFYSGHGHGIVATSNGSDHWDHAGVFSAYYGYGVYATSTENMAIRGEAGDITGLAQPMGPVGVAGIGDRGVFGGGNFAGVYGTSNDNDGYGGYFANSSAEGVALYAYGNGGGRLDATFRAVNYEASGGMAAYLTNDSNYHNAHFYNGGSGGVLYLQNGGTGATGTGGGEFITALNSDENDVQFRVETDGDVYSDGAFYPAGADFAELLPAAEGLEPGDVLVISADGQLARSSEPYQPTVVGVYSTQPGFVGGASEDGEQEGQVPLAIVGVVPVKASAENGPILPGDLLTASATAGHAMRAGEFVGGTIVGKALEGLKDGTGVIQMLVMLQ